MFKKSIYVYAVAAVLALSAFSQYRAVAQDDPCGVTGGDPEPPCPPPPPPPGHMKADSKTMYLHDLKFLKKIQLNAADVQPHTYAKVAVRN